VLQNTNKFFIYDNLNNVSILKKQSLKFKLSIVFNNIDNSTFFLPALNDIPQSNTSKLLPTH